ncbi:hypothetical protein MKZ38_010688 [Zalerion maritima]|uniref:Uncharacterized protein n=1 Tax=Zalerion maritima TaxID=339359 RepID=A0AAD5RTL8_9PEZI|nr:hypothetical protein MKZ38_010688 [Zalerion maritima]
MLTTASAAVEQGTEDVVDATMRVFPSALSKEQRMLPISVPTQSREPIDLRYDAQARAFLAGLRKTASHTLDAAGSVARVSRGDSETGDVVWDTWLKRSAVVSPS